MTFNKKSFLYFILLIPHMNMAYAKDNFSFSFTPTMYFFNYKEFDQADQLLDKEQGLLPGFRISLNHTNDNDAIEAHFALYGGQVDYIGQTQSGTPHETDTDEQLLNIGLKLLPKNVKVLNGQIFMGLQFWRWDRDILTVNNVRGLHEIYTWSEIEAGLEFTFEPTNQSFLWTEISALYTFNPNMEIYLESTKETLNLGEEPGFRLRAGKTWKHNQTTSLSFGLLVEYWSFGRSNTIFTSDFFGRSALITEPRSESLHTGLEFSYIQHF